MKTIPNHQFLAIVRKRAVQIARRRKQHMVSADDLRSYCAHQKIQPKSQGVWGNVFRTAGWEKVDHKQSTTPSRRGGVQYRWFWVGGAA